MQQKYDNDSGHGGDGDGVDDADDNGGVDNVERMLLLLLNGYSWPMGAVDGNNYFALNSLFYLDCWIFGQNYMK